MRPAARRRILGVVVVAVLAGCLGLAAAGSATLHAVGPCTAQVCPPENPCCNACGFSDWQERGSARVAVAAPWASPLPACDLDGCGRCDHTLRAIGVPLPGRFVVLFWARA